MRIKYLKKGLASLLLSVMLLTTVFGCGKDGAGQTAQTESGSQEAQDTSGGQTQGDAGGQTQKEGKETNGNNGENQAMGRYVEEIIDLSDRCSGHNSTLSVQKDGSLVIVDNQKGFLVSEDNGFTWQLETAGWYEDLLEEEIYIMDMKMDSEGNAYVIYDDGDGEDFHTSMKIVKADGTEIPVTVSLTEEERYLRNVWISDTDRVFVTVSGSVNIYEVKADGTSEKFLTAEGRPELMQIRGNLMLMDCIVSAPLIYDMEKEEYIEDQVLADFVQQNYKNRNTNGSSWFDLYLFWGEEDVLYLAGEGGLYRHVLGGSVVEEVADGSLCTLGNPAYVLLSMIPLENNEFLALFNGGRLVRFTYDAEVPTVPGESLKVYSLRENDTLRQAISLFQSENPGIFVEYEIGMGADSSVTREDALKNLNTRIMAGEGPDVLILDELPMDSYIEKGLLADLSGVLDGLSGEDVLFTNIVDAFRSDAGIFAVPCEVQIPVLSAEEKYISQMKDLQGIADGLEMIDQDKPEKGLLGIYSEKGIMRNFSMVCAPAWKKADGSISEEALTEFYTEIKRIYDAQMQGASEEIVARYEESNAYFLQETGATIDDSEYLRSRGVSGISCLADDISLIHGALSYFYSYMDAVSVSKVKGYEDFKIIPMTGQSSNVFLAETLVGISAVSGQRQQAEAFLKVLLGKENQSNLYYGFAVNKAAFEEALIPDDAVSEDGIYGYHSMGNQDGLYVEMAVYWPDEEQTALLKGWMEQAATPYIEDPILEDAVYAEGTEYLQGKQSLQETVDGVIKRTALSLAE